MRQQLVFQQRLHGDGFLVAALGGADHLLQLLFAALEVGQRQFGIDDLDVCLGVDLVGDMDDVLVLEAAHHVGDGIGLTDIGQELVAQPFALGGAGDQSGDIDKLHGGGDFALRLEQ